MMSSRTAARSSRTPSLHSYRRKGLPNCFCLFAKWLNIYRDGERQRERAENLVESVLELTWMDLGFWNSRMQHTREWSRF